MNQFDWDSYLDTVQSISLSNDHDQLLKFIEVEKNKYPEDDSLKNFFIAEHAFYTKQYKLALKHYIHARKTPIYNFFCYRASAAIALITHSSTMAIRYAKKALRIRSNDYATLKMLADIYTRRKQYNKAIIIKKRLDTLQSSHKKQTENNPSEPSTTVNEKGFQEFKAIFSQSKPEEEELFSFESHTDNSD